MFAGKTWYCTMPTEQKVKKNEGKNCVVFIGNVHIYIHSNDSVVHMECVAHGYAYDSQL